MRIYIFKSDVTKNLKAFAGDLSGSKLPGRFRPWHSIGVVDAGRAPPHNLPRDQIERAINTEGFQLWRMKAKAS